jgi:hypothetical protein
MTLLTVADFRQFDAAEAFEDTAIQLLLDATEAEIVRAAGPAGSATEYVRSGGRYTYLRRKAASVTSVTETDTSGTSLVLAADDYALWPAGAVIERLRTGTNPRSTWRDRSVVVYVPADDSDIRTGVQLDLMRLAMNYNPGTTAETIGSWSEQLASNSAWNASKERATILDRLRDGPGMVIT